MKNKKYFEIESKRLDYLFKNLPSAMVGALVISSIIFFSFKGIVSDTLLNFWFASTIVVTLLRVVLLVKYKRNKSELKSTRRYYVLFFIGIFFSAFVWGLSPLLIFPKEIEYQVLLVIMTGGLISGAALSTASRIEVFYTYLLLSSSPLIFTFMIIQSSISHVVSLALILYAILVSIMAIGISRSVNENILLAFENRDLISKLEDKVNEANSANEAKSKFLSTMSHEIRTPLNAIIGFIKILKDGEKNSSKLKYLNTIDKSSYMLLNVLNDILDFSKIQSGEFTIEKIPFNPKEQFESIYVLFEEVAKESGVVLKKSISSTMPTTIINDKLRIQQVVSNLLSNAIKFTPEGKEVEFIVSYDSDGLLLHVEVNDKGIGISKDNMKSVLEDFKQADSSVSRKYGGTGLGLPIANNLLKLLDSKLHVKSELGVGSSFSFDIPVEVVDSEDCDTPKEDSSDEIEVNLRDKKVLLAEDNKTNQLLMTILLDKKGLDTDIANDGVEAESLFESGSYDIVLMDINMPNKNGLDAMLDIKEYEKNHSDRKTPIIAVTANAIDGDKEMYIKKGFDDYLAKPVNQNELNNILNMHLA